jgi:hypothetical protein
MMEKLAQAGDGIGGVHAYPFHSIYHHVQSCSVSLHTLILLQKKLRYKYLKNEQIFLICKF